MSLSYQPKYTEGDEFILNGHFHTVLDVRENEDKNEVEYKVSHNGRFRWKSAPYIDRESVQYFFPELNGKTV